MKGRRFLNQALKSKAPEDAYNLPWDYKLRNSQEAKYSDYTLGLYYNKEHLVLIFPSR